jgi:hypothetical protein
MEYPIDLVYLWVDGSDPAWCEKKNKYIALANNAELKAARPERWRDNDELRHSLRSVEQFVPWINHIYLVTDGQCPAWLNTANPKITLVKHSDFIPSEFLPLYNATAIEFFLPYISALSEHFIYANDDMFFGRPVPPERFFDRDGNPRVKVRRLAKESFVGHPEKYDALLEPTSAMASRYRANILIGKLFNCDSNYEAAHVIDPYRKSYMLEMLAEPALQEALEMNHHARFRSGKQLQRIIFSLYDAFKGRTTLLDSRRWQNLRRLFTPWRMPMLISKTQDLEKILKVRPEQFCYYDEGLIPPEALQDFFRRFFPQKSSFEK